MGGAGGTYVRLGLGASNGGGGAGFKGNGGNGATSLHGYSGYGGKGPPSFAGGASNTTLAYGALTAAGGFGGGGSGGLHGGGGGGYSGGGGGTGQITSLGGGGSGGGGGSFDSGTDQTLVAGENSGNGLVIIAPVDTPTITGTAANQPTASTAAIDPFTSVVIADPNLGALPETLTVTPSPTANGALSDPNAATDHSTISGGTYTVTGTATQVQTDLRGLVFTPATNQSGQPVTTGFTISDTNIAGQTATDSMTSVVASQPIQPSTIAGTVANQATTDAATIMPFSTVMISDPDVGAQDSLVITLLGSTGGTGAMGVGAGKVTATDANGTLSGTGLTKTGIGTYALAATSPANLTSELDALTFTPTKGEVGPGQSVTTTFDLAATQFGVTTTDDTTSVIATAPGVASTVTVPTADQTQTTTGIATVTPLAGVTISDPNAGSPTETVTVTPSPTTNGTLSDPNAATDHSTTSSGAITLTGPATTVTTDLDALTFTPAFGQFGTTTFTITDTNSAAQASTPGTASVIVNPPPPPTTAQLKQIGTDLLQFYKDDLAHKSTTADAGKLATDFTTLDLSQAELGQLLGQTLTSATLASPAATMLGADIAATYYSKITTDLAHSGQGLAGDLTAMIGTTVAAGADDLLRTHFGQTTTAAVTATVTDFKLA